MPSGKIKSFSSQKGFGFIAHENGESVFFHISSVQKDSVDNVRSGALVSFDENPTPKGLRAENVAVIEKSIDKLVAPKGDDFFVSKSDKVGRENMVAFARAPVTVEAKGDPQVAVEKLKSKAKAIGCNALINLKRDRRTGSSGNYQFTIHVISAEPALVKRRVPTLNPNEAESSIEATEKEIEEIKKATLGDELIPDDTGLLVFVVAIAVLLFVLLFLGAAL